MKNLAIAGALTLAALTLGGCTATSNAVTDYYASLDKCTQIAAPTGLVLGIGVMGPPGLIIGPVAGAGGCYAVKHFGGK